MGNHIAQDVLEMYVLGEISGTDADHVDEHLSACEECRHVVVLAEWAVSLVATAARRASGLIAVHAVEQGSAGLTTRKVADG